MTVCEAGAIETALWLAMATVMVTVAVAEETHVESEDIAQIQVDHRTPRQDALRLALRQYPDLVLMLDVDGLGDRDTTRDVFQAATANKVIASCRWNDAADSLAGLLLMGVDVRLLAHTVRGIVAPRAPCPVSWVSSSWGIQRPWRLRAQACSRLIASSNANEATSIATAIAVAPA